MILYKRIIRICQRFFLLFNISYLNVIFRNKIFRYFSFWYVLSTSWENLTNLSLSNYGCLSHNGSRHILNYLNTCPWMSKTSHNSSLKQTLSGLFLKCICQMTLGLEIWFLSEMLLPIFHNINCLTSFKI
jgi:hypothetical protein